MSKALICDIDGTLTETLSGSKFKLHSQDVKVINGVLEGINHYQKQGFWIYGVSNQGGIAAKHKSTDATIKEMQFTLQLIPQLEYISFCPDYEGNQLLEIYHRGEFQEFTRDTGKYAEFRKPGAGMIQKIINDWNITEAIMVGDRAEDEQAAFAANIPFMLAANFHKGLYL